MSEVIWLTVEARGTTGERGREGGGKGKGERQRRGDCDYVKEVELSTKGDKEKGGQETEVAHTTQNVLALQNPTSLGTCLQFLTAMQ